MNNINALQTAPDLHDKDESIFQALMTAIVEHQLLPGSKLPEEALAEVLDALVAQVREHAVDVVIVAGDVFDSATPAASAYTLLDDALLALHETGATVVMTSGNHDSAARLGFHSRLLRDGIHKHHPWEVPAVFVDESLFPLPEVAK